MQQLCVPHCGNECGKVVPFAVYLPSYLYQCNFGNAIHFVIYVELKWNGEKTIPSISCIFVSTKIEFCIKSIGLRHKNHCSIDDKYRQISTNIGHSGKQIYFRDSYLLILVNLLLTS